MRAALLTGDGLVVDLIVLPDGDPDPVPVFVDGVQLFEDTPTGEHDEDGNPITEPRPVMAPGAGYNPPDGLTLIELPDDDQVGPGWRRVGDDWEPPTPDPVADQPAIDRLAAVLDAAGITPEQIIAALS